jgi:hypothetical protein
MQLEETYGKLECPEFVVGSFSFLYRTYSAPSWLYVDQGLRAFAKPWRSPLAKLRARRWRSGEWTIYR